METKIKPITEEQKAAYLSRTTVKYSGGIWQIYANFIGGDSAVGNTIETAAANYAKAVARTFCNQEMDWESFLSQPVYENQTSNQP
jgi:hypothetical protein